MVFSFTSLTYFSSFVAFLGSLRSDVFERRTLTGSEPFSHLIFLYATKFALQSVFIHSSLPVDFRRSKTSLDSCETSPLIRGEQNAHHRYSVGFANNVAKRVELTPSHNK